MPESHPECVIRPPTEADLPSIRALWAHAETMAPVGGVVLRSLEEMRSWLSKVTAQSGKHVYRVVVDPEGRVVGEVSAHRVRWPEGRGDFNLKIHADFRGRGLGDAAARAFLAEYFGPIGGMVLVDRIRPDNHGADRLLRRLGFVPAEEDATVFVLSRE